MKSLFLVLFTLLTCCSHAQEYYSPDQENVAFENGDLLFQDLDCGALCDAIETVTPAYDGRHFSHMGMVYIHNDEISVIEAIGNDVHLTPLLTFLNRQQDSAGHRKVLHGRLKKPARKLIPEAVSFALKQLRKPYDPVFAYGNGKYYCSELIYDAFRFANKNKPFFHLQPMTFKDPATGKTFPAWSAYYRQLNTPIPEGKPGCNPGGIAVSDQIDILAAYY